MTLETANSALVESDGYDWLFLYSREGPRILVEFADNLSATGLGAAVDALDRGADRAECVQARFPVFRDVPQSGFKPS
jgi:hypothetical protein